MQDSIFMRSSAKAQSFASESPDRDNTHSSNCGFHSRGKCTSRCDDSRTLPWTYIPRMSGGNRSWLLYKRLVACASKHRSITSCTHVSACSQFFDFKSLAPAAPSLATHAYSRGAISPMKHQGCVRTSHPHRCHTTCPHRHQSGTPSIQASMPHGPSMRDKMLSTSRRDRSRFPVVVLAKEVLFTLSCGTSIAESMAV